MEMFVPKINETALLIVDIQERLAAVMKERANVAANCLHVVELARMLKLPVIVTEQYSKGLGPTIPEIRESLEEYRPLEKLSFSCCEEPAFMEAVKATGRKTLLITGMETHICVLQTTIGLLKHGYHVHIVQDAVCSRTKANWKTGIEFMRDAGAVITCTETALFQLLKVAGTEEFKTISKRIR